MSNGLEQVNDQKINKQQPLGNFKSFNNGTSKGSGSSIVDWFKKLFQKKTSISDENLTPDLSIGEPTIENDDSDNQSDLYQETKKKSNNLKEFLMKNQYGKFNSTFGYLIDKDKIFVASIEKNARIKTLHMMNIKYLRRI